MAVLDLLFFTSDEAKRKIWSRDLRVYAQFPVGLVWKEETANTVLPVQAERTLTPFFTCCIIYKLTLAGLSWKAGGLALVNYTST